MIAIAAFDAENRIRGGKRPFTGMMRNIEFTAFFETLSRT